MTSKKQQINNLLAAVTAHTSTLGESYCAKLEQAATPILQWIDHLSISEATGNADVLLTGARGAVLETAGSASLGLVRSALFSIRGQIDLLLSWLFFKDHRVEWAYLEDTSDGFKLKTDVIRYLEDYIPGFKRRYGLLMQCSTRKEKDPYRLLSAHVHSQSTPTVPSFKDLASLIGTPNLLDDLVVLQTSVAEYLSDILLSIYADKWASLPETIIKDARGRMSVAQAKDFF